MDILFMDQIRRGKGLFPQTRHQESRHEEALAIVPNYIRQSPLESFEASPGEIPRFSVRFNTCSTFRLYAQLDATTQSGGEDGLALFVTLRAAPCKGGGFLQLPMFVPASDRDPICRGTSASQR